METTDRIVIDPARCHGKPIICGTRVPVSVVVACLVAGLTINEIQRQYR
jgi:uncharacterized protein (DUF433 family)